MLFSHPASLNVDVAQDLEVIARVQVRVGAIKEYALMTGA